MNTGEEVLRQGGDARLPAIPRTIAAIAEALDPTRRVEFQTAAHHARQGTELDSVLMTWWLEAMFEAVPGRDRRLDDTVAGVGLVELEPETEA
ncbi:hypothetical protein [Streptomyces bauhiniae]|uniref:Uncharacterized protein n=1 Tax=Streptomyces bauhiniae TaxID=2340725 RepID=A0A7K3QVP1_9ACTN|nr:hypothetical protein [Streptomyces bauhiniae]NEB93909.1 hypothetical protein [Streptomyces bauhiniae]